MNKDLALSQDDLLQAYIKRKNRRKLALAYCLVLPAFLVVMMIIAYPIVRSVVQSFTIKGQEGFTLANYEWAFTNPVSTSSIIFTLQYAAIVLTCVMVFGYLLALFLRFRKNWVTKSIGVLYLIPRFVPGMVAICAIILMYRDAGVINRISVLFGGDLKLGWIYNMPGIIITELWFNIPFAALIIASALGGISDSIIESARDCGANKWIVFAKIIMPLSIKDVLIAATFTFMGTASTYNTPLLVGPTSPKALAVTLFYQFNSYLNRERAATVSVIMFLLCAFSAVVYIINNLKETKWEHQ